MLLIRLPEHSLKIRVMSMSHFSVNKLRLEAQVVESIMSRKTNTSTESQERDRAEFLPCYKRMYWQILKVAEDPSKHVGSRT